MAVGGGPEAFLDSSEWGAPSSVCKWKNQETRLERYSPIIINSHYILQVSQQQLPIKSDFNKLY